MGFEYRTVDRETFDTQSNEYEAIEHLDLWQDVPNAGKLFLWLDWAQAKNSSDLNRLGRGFLAIKGFRFNDLVLNGLIGDSSIVFTNIPEKFSNTIYPDIYFRGVQADLFSKWGAVQSFAGKVERLQGLLGKIYDASDESLYGFKAGFRPLPQLLLGTGFIRTQDEVDSTDRKVTKSNNILLVDSEFQAFNWMKWLTEFRGSDYRGESGTEDHKDYMLRLGPMLKTENLRLEVNYRRIGTNYHFVNDATQVEQDQEGFFLLTEYKPWKQLLVFGNADRFNDNVADHPTRNTTVNQRAMLGLSFFSLEYPSFNISFDIMDRNSRFSFPSPVDNLTSTLYSEVRYYFQDFNPYLRYRWMDYQDEITKVNEYAENNITLGLRKNFKQGSSIYVEAEMDQKDFQNSESENRWSGKVGFNYYYSRRFYCWGEGIYSRPKDRIEDTPRNTIEGAFGLSYELPWGIQLSGDARYGRALYLDREEHKFKGFEATFRISKRFLWGKRGKIAGLKPGVETKGYGTIEGIVFNDINRNGIQEMGEEGIKEVTIYLEEGSKVKTNEKGFFQFPRVEEGNHMVNLDVKRIPADYNIISPERVKVEVKLRETGRVNFQLIAAGRIEGQVINDVNGNGKVDPGEKGIPDVLILLEPGNINTYTDEDGKFVFENILPGEYILKVDPATLPEDAIFTAPPELKLDILVGEGFKDKNFLIHVKPRPILIGPSKP